MTPGMSAEELAGHQLSSKLVGDKSAAGKASEKIVTLGKQGH
jgi:hypothetical protein